MLGLEDLPCPGYLEKLPQGLLLCPGIDLCNHTSVAPTANVKLQAGGALTVIHGGKVCFVWCHLWGCNRGCNSVTYLDLFGVTYGVWG